MAYNGWTLPPNQWDSNIQAANAEMESVSRYAAEAAERQRQAQIAEAQRQAEEARTRNPSDPYGVGTGSSGSFGSFFGRPYGGIRRSKRSRKSRKSRRSTRR
jgi:hypothetical protein